MAASGQEDRNRKVSITTLAFSTLSPGLKLVPEKAPQAKGGDWAIIEEKGKTEGEAAKSDSNKAATNEASAASTSRPPHHQHPSGSSMNNGETQHQVSEESGGASKPSAEVLSRLYSTTPATSSYGEKSRFNFKAKSGAGSISSMEQATIQLPKQISVTEDGGPDPPMSPVSKQLQNQISPKTSIGSGEPSPR